MCLIYAKFEAIYWYKTNRRKRAYGLKKFLCRGLLKMRMRTREKITRWLLQNRWQLDPEKYRKYRDWAENLHPRTRVKRIKQLEEEINLLEKEIEKSIAAEQKLRSKLSALEEVQSEYHERLEEQAFVAKIRKDVVTNPVGFVKKVFGPEEGLKKLKHWQSECNSEYTLGVEEDCRALYRYGHSAYDKRGSWVTQFDHVIREPKVLWRLIVASKEYKEVGQ